MLTNAKVLNATADLWEALEQSGWEGIDGGDLYIKHGEDIDDIHIEWAAYVRAPNGKMYQIIGIPVSEDDRDRMGGFTGKL